MSKKKLDKKKLDKIIKDAVERAAKAKREHEILYIQLSAGPVNEDLFLRSQKNMVEKLQELLTLKLLIQEELSLDNEMVQEYFQLPGIRPIVEKMQKRLKKAAQQRKLV